MPAAGGSPGLQQASDAQAEKKKQKERSLSRKWRSLSALHQDVLQSVRSERAEGELSGLRRAAAFLPGIRAHGGEEPEFLGVAREIAFKEALRLEVVFLGCRIADFAG